MIKGIGIDLAEIDRIQRIWNNPVPRLAVLFAAKEAAVKALGTGFREGIGFQCIEVLHQPNGKPEIIFHGHGKKKCEELGVTHAHVTLTHSRDTAGATVILER